MSERLGYMLLAIVWMCWGLSYPATAIALGSMDVWTSRVLVMPISGVALLLVVVLQGGSLRIPRIYWRDMAILAVANMSIFQICMTSGVALMSPGRTAVIIYTMPIWATFFAVFLLGERVKWPHVAGLCLGVSGLALLMSQDLSNLTNAPLGAALTLCASISFAFGTVWMKRRTWHVDLTAFGGWQILVGWLPIGVIWLFVAPENAFARVDTPGWLAVAYLAFCANALAYFAWFRVVTIFPATVSGIGTLVVPCIGVLSSALVVGELLGWRDFAALGLICSALALVVLVPAYRNHRTAAKARRAA